MRILALQHVPFETPGYIEKIISRKKHNFTVHKVWENTGLPSADSFDMLIVLGGSMGVNDTTKHPWLIPEKHLIKSAVNTDKKVLGICLGAQLIAQSLGARVYPGTHKEIGWFPVNKCSGVSGMNMDNILPESMDVFHWHGDTFDLPDGAERIASSSVTENQGFVYKNNVLALQFHLEVTADSVEKLITNSAKELADGGEYVQPDGEIRKGLFKITKINNIMQNIWEQFEK
jgi:GMP synthase (glutamine-hydrolysing)